MQSATKLDNTPPFVGGFKNQGTHYLPYLVDEFGVDGLYEADKRSGWFDCDSIDEFAEAITIEMDNAE